MTIINFGDLFDDRKGVGTISIAESKRIFFDVMATKGINFHALIGNHDLPLKHSNKLSSPEQLLNEYENVTLYAKPSKIKLGKFSVDIIPWITTENHDSVMEFIKKSTSDLLFAHLELDTFQMQKGVASHGGLSPKIFEKYQHVYSGHFHSSSTKGNITYLGVPYEMTFADAEEDKKIWIFDTETGETETIVNPFTMFTKLYYDEDENAENSFLPEQITDHYVKLYVLNRKDLKKYDKYIEILQQQSPFDIKVIEEYVKIESSADDSVSMHDTPALIDSYIDNMDDEELDKDRLKKMMRLLYLESQNME